MANETDTPAGGGDDTSLTSEAAAERIMGLLGPEDDEENDSPESDAGQESTEDAAASEEADEANQSDDQSEPEGEDEETEIVHGNAKVRLRDGRLVPVAELKKLVDREPEFQRQQAEIAERQQQLRAAAEQFQAQQAHIAQQAQFFAQAIPAVLEKARADIPPPVPEEFWDQDPIEAMRLDRIRAKKIQDFQQIQHQAQTFHQQKQAEYQQHTLAAQQAAEAQKQAYVKEQFERLMDERPDLKNPEKAKAYVEKLITTGTAYGFSPEQVSAVADVRLIKLIEDAAAYRALRSQKPAVAQRVASAPPVRAPGRRVSDAEQAARSHDEGMAKLRKSGRPEDAAALIAKLL